MRLIYSYRTPTGFFKRRFIKEGQENMKYLVKISINSVIVIGVCLNKIVFTLL